MTEPTPEEKPADGAPPEKPAEEAQAEPYNAAASNEPTVDTSASVEHEEEEEEEIVVEGDHPWAMACHLAVFANMFIPLSGFVVPLVIREAKHKEDPEVNHHSKEALNFQINVVPLALILLVMGFVGMTSGCFLFIPAILGFPALIIASTVYAVIGAMAASEGKRFRYPYIVRFVK